MPVFVEYDYGISPQIYANDQYGIRQVNPDATMKKLGMGTSSNSMMSSMMNTNVFLFSSISCLFI